MDWINITGSGLITQVYIHQDFFRSLRYRYFKVLLFGCEGLDTGITDQSELLVRPEHHDTIPAVRGLGHIDFGDFGYNFAFFPAGGHFQDHLCFGRSAVGNTMTGLVAYFCFNHYHWDEHIVLGLEEVPEGLDIHRQGGF